uniref:Aquaporin n=1 Tax=Megaselia scalaris TaxID=36166 RepID=T1GER8_MEGSC
MKSKDPRNSVMKAKVLDMISIFLAELIGTALLVFFGCMGCIDFNNGDSIQMTNSLFQISVVFGLVIMFIVQIFGCVSGAHLNPAVTIAAIVYKLLTPAMAVGYFVAQMGGAFIGYGLLQILVAKDVMANEHGVGMFIELIGTGTLIWVVCGVWDPRNAKGHDAVPLKLGFAITALCGCFGHWTGCSMNPARSFGPALWNMDFGQHWVYWVGPLLGGLLASLSYRHVFYRNQLRSMRREGWKRWL